jgi:crotonobetainyl-CoA:carnitine CoA-transferase CaiB-like acyl-CoA transferase
MADDLKSTTVRISVATRDKIAQLAREAGQPMNAIIDDAIKQYERKHFWQKLNEQIERTQREDPESWAEYAAERDIAMGPPSRSRRVAPEWEGLITFPEETGDIHPR